MRDVAHWTLTGRMTTGTNNYFGGVDVHGNGRKPSRVDRMRPDFAAIAAWTAANLRARRAYYAQPNSATRGVASVYGGGKR